MKRSIAQMRDTKKIRRHLKILRKCMNTFRSLDLLYCRDRQWGTREASDVSLIVAVDMGKAYDYAWDAIRLLETTLVIMKRHSEEEVKRRRWEAEIARYSNEFYHED